jgi:DMSO/TMAO reductase YedYZ molybdopterin-dependent catalytic subunit
MPLALVDPDRPPPGPFRAGFWRSPLRGPWLTSLLGLALLVAIPLVAITGLLSNVAYDPRLGGNAAGRALGPLDFYLFAWPTRPSWLYALTQGLHVSVGLAATPILLAKLWSVIPKLFEWPPARSVAHALERLSLALLVGGALFEFATGILDIQYAYVFRFFFTDAHYYGAWVFTAAFVFHVAIKLSTMRSALKARHGLRPLRESLARTRPEPAGPIDSGLIPVAPEQPTMSRRALIASVGAGSLLLLVQGAGDSIGGPLRGLAFLGPRDRAGSGPNGFPINRTASSASIEPSALGAGWALRLEGDRRAIELSRAQLLEMPQSTYDLPIACVEGWSTTQRWTGVRVRELAALLGMDGELTVESSSLERGGVFSSATLAPNQAGDARTLLALKVNGADLSLDHGFPARIIGPALPGVHCTKWVSEMTFRAA